ncbi:MAG: hypothetical protein WBP72_16025 [Rhodocyclaceae bacterium]
MDQILVFCRTAAGEDAVRQPTRLVQRNLRSALLLVNGVRNTEEILSHFVDKTIGSAALADLQRARLIEVLPKRAERGERAKPVDARPGATPGTVRLPEQVVESHSEAAGAIIETITLKDPEDYGQPFTTPRQEMRLRPECAPTRPQAVTTETSTLPPKGEKTATQNLNTNPPGRRPGRGEPRETNRFLKLIAGLIGLLVLCAGVTTLGPYDRHRTEMQQRPAVALGEPVAIGVIA